MRIAVVVTTYNRPDALRAVLEGYAAQTDDDFDILVADDGSTIETEQVVKQYARRLKNPVAHVWQEDHGFRAAAIRNRAVARTSADYVVFTDGDCVPPPSFVASHRALAERGCFVAGNRVLLSEPFTRRVLAERVPIHDWRACQWAGAWMRRDANRLLPLLHRSAQAGFRKAEPQRWSGVKTCNLAVWRNDILHVNGLDETYEGWGLEDSDFAIRLLHAGLGHKSGRFFVPVFHLWHRDNDRGNLERNQSRLDQLLSTTRYRAECGIDRYLGGRQ